MRTIADKTNEKIRRAVCMIFCPLRPCAGNPFFMLPGVRTPSDTGKPFTNLTRGKRLNGITPRGTAQPHHPFEPAGVSSGIKQEFPPLSINNLEREFAHKARKCSSIKCENLSLFAHIMRISEYSYSQCRLKRLTFSYQANSSFTHNSALTVIKFELTVITVLHSRFSLHIAFALGNLKGEGSAI